MTYFVSDEIYNIDGVLNDEQYNIKVKEIFSRVSNDGYRRLNHFVMNHTCGKCKFDDELSSIVKHSIENQKIVYSKNT